MWTSGGTRNTITAASVVAAFLAIGVALVAERAAAQAPAQSTPVFRTGTTAVLLDIVVRDKRGRPIRDLRQDEITVLEDGAPREVKSFRLIEGAPADAGLATPGSGVVQPDPLRRVTLVSLVFDHLSQNGRKLAQKAAHDYLLKPLPAGQWVAVFSLDNRLHMQHDFSRNVGALSAAVDRATTSSRRRTRRRCRGRPANRRVPSSTARRRAAKAPSTPPPPAPTRSPSRCAR